MPGLAMLVPVGDMHPANTGGSADSATLAPPAVFQCPPLEMPPHVIVADRPPMPELVAIPKEVLPLPALVPIPRDPKPPDDLPMPPLVGLVPEHLHPPLEDIPRDDPWSDWVPVELIVAEPTHIEEQLPPRWMIVELPGATSRGPRLETNPEPPSGHAEPRPPPPRDVSEMTESEKWAIRQQNERAVREFAKLFLHGYVMFTAWELHTGETTPRDVLVDVMLDAALSGVVRGLGRMRRSRINTGESTWDMPSASRAQTSLGTAGAPTSRRKLPTDGIPDDRNWRNSPYGPASVLKNVRGEADGYFIQYDRDAYVLVVGPTGHPGQYAVPIGTNRQEAIAIARQSAQAGERYLREDIALLKAWKDPAEAVSIYRLPANTPVVVSVVGPQVEPSGVKYAGGSLQLIMSRSSAASMTLEFSIKVTRP